MQECLELLEDCHQTRLTGNSEHALGVRDEDDGLLVGRGREDLSDDVGAQESDETLCRLFTMDGNLTTLLPRL